VFIPPVPEVPIAKKGKGHSRPPSYYVRLAKRAAKRTASNQVQVVRNVIEIERKVVQNLTLSCSCVDQVQKIAAKLTDKPVRDPSILTVKQDESIKSQRAPPSYPQLEWTDLYFTLECSWVNMMQPLRSERVGLTNGRGEEKIRWITPSDRRPLESLFRASSTDPTRIATWRLLEPVRGVLVAQVLRSLWPSIAISDNVKVPEGHFAIIFVHPSTRENKRHQM
jgi:hypothetical protein